MKKSLILTICGCFFLVTTIINAQTEQQHFRATASAGANFSQIEGDAQQGYSKIGVSVGVKGAYCFKPKFDMSAELLYNSRGGQPSFKAAPLNFSDRSPLFKAELNYADITLAANFHSMPDNSLTFYRQSFQIGLTYGRLLSSKITIQSNRGDSYNTSLENELQDALKKDDIGVMVGYTRNVTSRLGIGIKHTFSLRKIYMNPNNGLGNAYFNSFLPYNLSLNLVFNIFSPKPNIKAQVEKEKKAKDRKVQNPLEDL
jgi:Outer membrane protein beta-barrel domain